MITVSSYLRSADGTFVPVSSATVPPPDPDYVEGAIELVVDGRTMIGQAEWDYVDQLWAYLVELVGTFEESGTAQTYFPDQPISVTLARINDDRALLTVEVRPDVRRASVLRAEFADTIRRAAIDFFQAMIPLLPTNADTYRTAIDAATHQ